MVISYLQCVKLNVKMKFLNKHCSHLIVRAIYDLEVCSYCEELFLRFRVFHCQQ